MKKQNSKGQFTNDMSILLTKKLQQIAEDEDIRLKTIVRDELERKYRDNVYASYSPISSTGKSVQEYNATHKHQKPAPYHHTGLFANSVKAVIDGNTVKVIIEDNKYDDGASTTQVYEWLTKGTTKNPKGDSYPYVKKQGDDYSTGWASYNPTPKHLFEQHTLVQMEGFLDWLMSDLERNAGKNIKKRYK